MPDYFDRIAATLGIMQEDVRAFCDTIRAACPRGLPPSNRDIADALQEVGRADVTPVRIAESAMRIAALRRARTRSTLGPSKIDKLRMINKRPTTFVRCACGSPAIPGGDVCYMCSS